MTRATLISAALVVALVAGCGDDDSGDLSVEDLQAVDDTAADAPACADLFAPGRPTDDVLADAGITGDDGGGLCVDDDEMIITVMPNFPCQDSDATVYYTTSGHSWSSYGIEGREWQQMPEGQNAPSIDVC